MRSIFDIIYYGKFSYRDVHDLPVFERRYLISLLGSEIKAGHGTNCPLLG